IFLDQQNKIYAIDSDHATESAKILDNNLSYITDITLNYKTNDLAVNSIGNIAMLNDDGFIRYVKPDGTIINKWSAFTNPAGSVDITDGQITFDKSGNIYAVYAAEVKKYSTTGNLLKKWTAEYSIKGIAVDEYGNTYLAEKAGEYYYQLNKYDPDGILICKIGNQYSKPCAVALDASNNLYVLDGDSALPYIYKYSPQYYYIKGKVKDFYGKGIPQVTVTLSGSKTATAITNAAGEYELTGLAIGNYTVTVSRTDCAFLTVTNTYTLLNSNQENQDIQGELLFNITGFVEGLNGTKIPGVTLTTNSGSTCITTDTGYYEFIGLNSGYHSVSASKDGYSFSPDARTYNLKGHCVDQNYTAVPSEVANAGAAIIGGERGYVNPAKGEKAYIAIKPVSTGTINIKVYDLQGTIVKEIDQDVPVIGTNVITWDCKNNNNEQIASGIYIIRFEGCGINETKKLAIIK
ncbi:MAG: carboxypeptidase regulatory-like domain-containing protein, partial [bacterium]|nr:carboxypeptidase regulatory-like domain-containing protein [bacterium]